MFRIFVLVALAVLGANYAAAQTCGSVQTTDPGLDNASLWPNPACPGWEDGSTSCEAATASTYGGTGTGAVAEIDAEPRTLIQDVTLRSGHTYVLSLTASRRTNCTATPNPVDADITFTNTNLGTYTVTRSNTTFALTAESTTLQASSSSGRLTIGPGSSFGSETCGLIVDDIELRHQAENTGAFTLSMTATVGSPHSLTLSNLTYSGDSYEIEYTITRASGSPSYNCTHTATPTSGSVSFSGCQNAAYGDTVEITAINNQGTVCDYPSTALPTLRDVVLFPSESKLAEAHYQQDGPDVLLRWRTDFELDTLGFHVYREVAGQRMRVTPSLVAGSALQYAGGQDRNGRSYTWRDRLPDGLDPSGVQYLIEAVELDGARRLIPARRTHRVLPPAAMSAGRARLLNQPVARAGQAALSVPQIPISVRRRVEARLGSRGMKLIAEGAMLSPQKGWSAIENGPLPSTCLPAPSAYERRQRTLAASPNALKLFVGRTGWHRVTRDQLVAAGLSEEATAEELALVRDGRPVAIRVVGQGRTYEAIEFFGATLDLPETGQAAYWLTRDEGLARRMASGPEPMSDDIQRDAVETLEIRERSLYFAAARRADGDHFFGPIVTSEPVAVAVKVGDVASEAALDARLDLELHGISTGSHLIEVSFNEVKLGTLRFDGKRYEQASLAVPHEIIASGDNELTLQAQGGQSDTSTVRLARLTYRRRLVVGSGEFRAVVDGNAPFAIEGLADRARLFDVTDPLAPRELRSAANSEAVVSQAAGAGQRLVLVASSAPLAPLAIERNRPSSWSQSHEAGFVILTHRELSRAANDLAKLRRDQGWSVEVAQVDDLYDEFSFGHRSAQALRCFIERSQMAWRRRPTHFLLFGDASFDPRDHLGLGSRDLVPSRFLPHREISAPTDDWFVRNASLPTSIGRLPASSEADARVMVDKLRSHDAQASTAAMKRLVLVSDFDEEGRFDFHGPLDEIAESLAADWQTDRIRITGTEGRSDARRAIISAFNGGAGIVDYFGHGSVEIWSGSAMDADAVGELRGDVYPFVLGMTCLNGLFTDLYSTSLAERLLARSQGGAVGVLAASTRGYPSDQAAINATLLAHLSERKSTTMGDAVRQVGRAMGDSSWILLADPTLRLHGMQADFGEGEDDLRRGLVLAGQPQADPADESSVSTSGGGGCSTGGGAAGSLGVLLLLLGLVCRRRRRVGA